MTQFENIAVGDQVIVHSGSYNGRRARAWTVSRVTATRFTAGGVQFTKRGFQVGGCGDWSAIAEPATPERIAKVVAENELRQRCCAVLRRSEAITARLHEIARNGGATHVALHGALIHLQAAMEQLTPPDAAAPQGGEVEA